MRAEATFRVGNWDEEVFAAAEGGSDLTRALVTGGYEGAIEGETTLAFLMHSLDGRTTFTGLERIVGKLGGRKGDFVVRHEGTFADGTLQTALTIVAGSATDDLRGLRGTGESVAPSGSAATVTLEYDFADLA